MRKKQKFCLKDYSVYDFQPKVIYFGRLCTTKGKIGICSSFIKDSSS